VKTLEYLKKYAYYYIYAIAITLALNVWICGEVRPVSGDLADSGRPKIVIDAGHGGIDGGTTSCTGVLESILNLEISKRLDPLFRLLGYETVLTRTGPDSVATEGETIRQQKISDLKNRVQMVEDADNALLISIHQNFYPGSRYAGPQVFYNAAGKELAATVQKGLNRISISKERSSKKSEGVYLMEHTKVPAILVECGFLSNPQEEALLRQADYQKKLCAALVAAVVEYVESGLFY